MEQGAGSTSFVVKTGTVASDKCDEVWMNEENKRKEARVAGHVAEVKQTCSAEAHEPVEVGLDIR
jgi:hypothetical protein